MGGKGSKTKITRYLMSGHWGLCIGPVDAVLSLSYGEKVFFQGRVTQNQVVNVSKTGLFGGDTKEGGVEGAVYFLLGDKDQVFPDALAQKLGRADGAHCPGYQGIASLFFTGKVSAPGNYTWNSNPDALYLIAAGIAGAPVASSPVSGKGFYWTANTPYLKDLWAQVQRIPRELDSTLAEIPSAVSPPSTGISKGYLWFAGVHNGVDASWIISPSNSKFTQTYAIAQGEQLVRAIDNKIISLQIANTFDTFDLGWAYSIGDFSGYPWARMQIRFNFIDSIGTVIAYVEQYVDGVFTGTANSFQPSQCGFRYGDNNGQQGDISVGASAGTYCTVRFNSTSLIGQVQSGTGKNFSVNCDPFSIKKIQVFGFIETATYGTGCGSALQITSRSAVNTPGSGDANPAHIIYECLTDQTWGMGNDPTTIDRTSFMTAAQTLYNEAFGMSLAWSSDSTIEDFVNGILSAIDGVLFTHPNTGLMTLSLTRDDYDVDSLRVITPSHSTMTAFARKALGETINEVQVEWTNPDSEQTETVTLQDPGNIAQQGAVVSTTNTYAGIRRQDLAMDVCARDLRQSSAMLTTGEFTGDRTYWDMVPNEVVKVNWPEYGIDQLVMRTASVTYGPKGGGAISFSLAEDIFALTKAKYTVPGGSNWTNPTQAPIPVTKYLVLPAPYYGLAQASNEDIDSLGSSSTFGMVLAAPPQSGASIYDLYGLEAQPNGDQDYAQELAAVPFIGYGQLTAAMKVEAFSWFPGLSGVVSNVSPDVGDLVIFADTVPYEVALVAEQDATTGMLKLWRGVLDTTPKVHAVGTAVWFGPSSSFEPDPTQLTAGSSPSYKLLTHSSYGVLNVDSAPVVSAAIPSRFALPFRPAAVRARGVAYRGLTVDPASVTSLGLTWALRNRTLEDSQMLTWLDAGTTPESGATVNVDVYGLDAGAHLDSKTALTGSSYALALAGYVSASGATKGIRVRLGAARNGDASYDGYSLDVYWGALKTLTNPGAEAGATTGWTIAGPGGINRSTTWKNSGSYSFIMSAAAATSTAWTTQDIALTAAEQIKADAGTLVANVLAQVYAYRRATKCYIDVGVAALDGNGDFLCGRMIGGDDLATAAQGLDAVLPLSRFTRSIRVAARFRRASGTAYVDDFELTTRTGSAVAYLIYSPTMVVSTGWATTNCALSDVTSTTDTGWGVPALGMAITGTTGTSTAYQVADVPAGAQTGIDSGKATVQFTGAITTDASAASRLAVQFLDAEGADLGWAYSRPYLAPSTFGEPEYDTLDATIPAKTRQLRFGVEAVGGGASETVVAQYNWLALHVLDSSGNSYNYPQPRVSEANELRISESGEIRITES